MSGLYLFVQILKQICIFHQMRTQSTIDFSKCRWSKAKRVVCREMELDV